MRTARQTGAAWPKDLRLIDSSWCRDNGYTLAGPSWEIYGHWRDELHSDPSKIRTDVYYLLVEA
jgi:effector-binding domain-containing protein